MSELLTFSADITADEASRTISGKIVPFGDEVGHTSAGRVIFEANSIALPESGKVKLLLEHDPKKPLGWSQNISSTDSEMTASFKLSSTQRATDSLIEASENLRSGLSVGVEVIKSKMKDGIIHVSSALLKEVSLVQAAAFKSAAVTSVLAEEAEIAETVEETQPTESEAVEVENTPDTVEAPEVEASAVEAARPTQSVAYTTPRVKPLTAGEYLGATLKASLGDESARQTILAADDSSSTNTGIVLPNHLSMFNTSTFSGRPAFDAVTRAALPANPAISFTVPKMGTAPTVAETAEAAAPSETGMTSTYDTITTKKYSGLQRISFELAELSSPAFMDLVMSELRKAYEKATDAALIAAFTASGTAATGVAATAAGLQSYIATESAAAYKGTGGSYARNLVASTDQWAAIMGYADSTGRGLYSAANPMNNSGAVSQGSTVGNILGANLIVDHNIATSGIVDESAFLIAQDAVYAWESPTTTLRVNQLTTGEFEINLYGYLAIGVLKPTGVRRFNLA